MTDKKKDNYEVGYGKPPKHSQFKKGRSGNSKGRPQGVKNKVNEDSLYAMIDREASRQVTVNNGEQKLTLTMAEVIIRNLAQLAAKSNTRAIAMFLEHLKIINEKQLSKAARVAKAKAGEIDDRLESFTDEQLDAFLELLEMVKNTNPPSPSPTPPTRPTKPKRLTDLDR